jgi:ParB family chromosome partitioning protein
VCKFTTDAITTERSDFGTVHKVCANPTCPVHHAKNPTRATANDAQFKAEQEKRRKEEAIANATGLRVLVAIGAAVPVRLMKRGFLFVAERLADLLDENRCAFLAKQHGIRKAKDNESVGKLFAAFLRRADESTLGRAVVEAVTLLAPSRGNASPVLRDAATAYKVDTDAIAAKVKQDFGVKEKAKTATKPAPKVLVKAQPKTGKKGSSSIIINPTGTLCGACHVGSAFLCSPARLTRPLAMFLPVEQERHIARARRAAPPADQRQPRVGSR